LRSFGGGVPKLPPGLLQRKETLMSRWLILIATAVVAVLAGFFLFRILSNDDTAPAASDTTTTTADTTTTVPATTTTVPQDTTTTTEADDGFPVTIDAPNGPVTIEARPERIVSISPTSTEVLFAVGAGDQVVAVDDQSNYPPEAPVSDLSGFTPNVEAIASYDPDLVILSFDPGDIIAGLEAVGIPVILHPSASTLDDAYTQWEQIGAATGRVSEAAAVVAGTMASLESSVASLPEGTDALSYYHELDPTFYSATSSTFIGSVYALTGMTNIADAADPDGYGFPQLSAEYIIDADPSLIFLADTKCCGQDAQTVGERPGWDTMTAVANGGVIELDDDVASRWGPRISEFVESIVASIVAFEPADA
jgi:iron complex transport system substrate-binding protein